MKKLIILSMLLLCPEMFGACACSFSSSSKPAVANRPVALKAKHHEENPVEEFQALKTQVLNLNLKSLPKDQRALFKEIRSFLQKINAANLATILKKNK